LASLLDALLQHEHQPDGRFGHGDEILGGGAVGNEDAEP
jgi:hypothetical protein